MPAPGQARQVALQILTAVERGAYADRALAAGLVRGHLDPRDVHLVTELVNGVLRMRGHLDWVLDQFVRGGMTRLSDAMKVTLRLGAYQILFMDKIPAPVAVHETVCLAKTFGRQKSADFVNAILRRTDRREFVYPDRNDDEVAFLSVMFSHPAWMVRRWVKCFGVEETEQICAANNQAPQVTVRVNKLKTSPQEALAYLSGRGCETRPGLYHGDFIHILKGWNPIEDDAFGNGWFFAQDESAGLPAVLLDPQPGERILDLCSAPGGKTTHVAQMMNNTGRILAADISPERLCLVTENCQRLGVTIVETWTGDGRTLGKETFDRILVDAPCSGTGVLARRSDSRWRKKHRQIADLAALQSELMEQASRRLKPGGVLVYSTCSIEAEEGEGVVEPFLAAHPEMDRQNAGQFVSPEVVNSQGYVRTFAHRHGIDGSFAVRLTRTR